MPAVLKRAPMSPLGCASSLPSTACIPRSMLMPWSASPIAESSSVRYSFCSAIVAAKTLSHSTTASYGMLVPVMPGHAPQRSPAVFTGASHSFVKSSFIFRSVIEQPAMSSEVM